MKRLIFLLLIAGISFSVTAAEKDSVVYYHLPDSVKAVSFLAEINVQPNNSKKFMYAGIKTDVVELALVDYKGKRRIQFSVPDKPRVVATGEKVDVWLKGAFSFNYNWSADKTYKLLIAVATDSAENFSIYSGYAWLPELDKWKLIGSCRISGRWTTIQKPASFTRKHSATTGTATMAQVWCQRNTGSWINMNDDMLPPPVINLLSHVDSLLQFQKEKEIIEKAIQKGETDVKENVEGVYYTILKEGTGQSITVNDTVTVHYKGYLFTNGIVFDQTKEKPATFPLKRLIKAWQIGIPLCKVGGKIKLVIPSALAYSIRTRAAKIPPNSILVFEIEVLDTKTPK